MAGHSKFKNIMHRKGAQDKRRSQIYSKLSREITVAAKTGQPDPNMNPRLRLAIQNARAENMSKDVIQRAIEKAAGAGGDGYEEVRYEGFGPGGVGLIVEVLTDNRNRTAADIRAILSRNGGNLGTTNSAASSFERIGEIAYPGRVADSDAMLEAAIEAGADDVQSDAEGHVVDCRPSDLAEVCEALIARFGDPSSARIIWRPLNTILVEGDTALSLLRLVDALEEHDDVQNVYANFEVSEADLAAMTA